MTRGLFISVEGIDGAGKSTHLKFIADYLAKHAKQVIITREPGGTDFGEKIRELLLHNHSPIHPVTELCLMFASRQELVNQVIAPNLAKGVCVLTDRFIDASIAYQGYGRNMGTAKVNSVAALLEPQLTPDLTLVFDVPLDIALERVTNHKAPDRIEAENANFFAAVQQGYYALATENPQRVKLINTQEEITATRKQISAYLDELLKQQP